MTAFASRALLVTAVLAAGCATSREGDMRVVLAAEPHGPVDTNGRTAADARALPTLDEDAVLTTYLQYAALNNPQLEAAYYRWQAAVERVPQARTLPDPRLTYARYIEEVETRVGPQENRLGIAQTFPWVGTLAAKADRAMAQAEAARWRYEQAKLSLFARVVDAYAEYYYIGRATVITEANLTLLEHFEEVARRRYEVAKAQYSDVVKAQVELGKLSDRVRTLRAMRPALAAPLNAALNRPTDTPIPWPNTLPQPITVYDVSQMHARLAQRNPELRALDSEVTAAERGVQLARLRYLPDVTLGLDWIDTGTAIMPTPDSGKDPVMATVSVTVPLWYQSYRAAEREAQAGVIVAMRAQEERENTLASRLDRAIFQYDDARRKMNLFRNTLVPKAEQSIQATETAFTTGTGDFLALLDAQRIFLEFQLSYERALADAVQHDADIATLVGAGDPESPPTTDPQTTEPEMHR